MDRVLIVRGFQRPDKGAEPGQEREVLGGPAENRLAEMDVALDEARHDQASVGIDDHVSAGDELADLGDAPVPDQDAAVLDHRSVRGRPYAAVFDQQIGHARSFT